MVDFCVQKKIMTSMAGLSSPFRLYRRQEIILAGENMKSTLNKFVSLMTSLKSPSPRRSGPYQMIGVRVACLLTACIASISAQAGTIGISYSLSGGPTGPPVVSGTTLILDGLFTGSILSGNPDLNAVWNPVTYRDHSVADRTTGLLNGTISITFANGDILSGNVFEDVSALIATGGIGPFTQTLTFTGGTGEFAGASGSVSGAGIGTSTGSTVSGTGTLTAAAVGAPEPASVTLIFGGLIMIALKARLIRQQG
jgi:hypothetical protein